MEVHAVSGGWVLEWSGGGSASVSTVVVGGVAGLLVIAATAAAGVRHRSSLRGYFHHHRRHQIARDDSRDKEGRPDGTRGEHRNATANPEAEAHLANSGSVARHGHERGDVTARCEEDEGLAMASGVPRGMDLSGLGPNSPRGGSDSPRSRGGRGLETIGDMTAETFQRLSTVVGGVVKSPVLLMAKVGSLASPRALSSPPPPLEERVFQLEVQVRALEEKYGDSAKAVVTELSLSPRNEKPRAARSLLRELETDERLEKRVQWLEDRLNERMETIEKTLSHIQSQLLRPDTAKLNLSPNPGDAIFQRQESLSGEESFHDADEQQSDNFDALESTSESLKSSATAPPAFHPGRTPVTLQGLDPLWASTEKEPLGAAKFAAQEHLRGGKSGEVGPEIASETRDRSDGIPGVEWASVAGEGPTEPSASFEGPQEEEDGTTVSARDDFHERVPSAVEASAKASEPALEDDSSGNSENSASMASGGDQPSGISAQLAESAAHETDAKESQNGAIAAVVQEDEYSLNESEGKFAEDAKAPAEHIKRVGEALPSDSQAVEPSSVAAQGTAELQEWRGLSAEEAEAQDESGNLEPSEPVDQKASEAPSMVPASSADLAQTPDHEQHEPEQESEKQRGQAPAQEDRADSSEVGPAPSEPREVAPAFVESEQEALVVETPPTVVPSAEFEKPERESEQASHVPEHALAQEDPVGKSSSAVLGSALASQCAPTFIEPEQEPLVEEGLSAAAAPSARFEQPVPEEPTRESEDEPAAVREAESEDEPAAVRVAELVRGVASSEPQIAPKFIEPEQEPLAEDDPSVAVAAPSARFEEERSDVQDEPAQDPERESKQQPTQVFEEEPEEERAGKSDIALALSEPQFTSKSLEPREALSKEPSAAAPSARFEDPAQEEPDQIPPQAPEEEPAQEAAQEDSAGTNGVARNALEPPESLAEKPSAARTPSARFEDPAQEEPDQIPPQAPEEEPAQEAAQEDSAATSGVARNSLEPPESLAEKPSAARTPSARFEDPAQEEPDQIPPQAPEEEPAQEAAQEDSAATSGVARNSLEPPESLAEKPSAARTPSAEPEDPAQEEPDQIPPQAPEEEPAQEAAQEDSAATSGVARNSLEPPESLAEKPSAARTPSAVPEDPAQEEPAENLTQAPSQEPLAASPSSVPVDSSVHVPSEPQLAPKVEESKEALANEEPEDRKPTEDVHVPAAGLQPGSPPGEEFYDADQGSGDFEPLKIHGHKSLTDADHGTIDTVHVATGTGSSSTAELAERAQGDVGGKDGDNVVAPSASTAEEEEAEHRRAEVSEPPQTSDRVESSELVELSELFEKEDGGSLPPATEPPEHPPADPLASARSLASPAGSDEGHARKQGALGRSNSEPRFVFNHEDHPSRKAADSEEPAHGREEVADMQCLPFRLPVRGEGKHSRRESEFKAVEDVGSPSRKLEGASSYVLSPRLSKMKERRKEKERDKRQEKDKEGSPSSALGDSDRKLGSWRGEEKGWKRSPRSEDKHKPFKQWRDRLRHAFSVSKDP